jgi:enoyl-CoA hydratase
MELLLWCDLRVAALDATFGFYDRRQGVPLIDGGTVRLPRLIGQSRALDMILTGRPVSGTEAFEIGLVNRLCEPGRALKEALVQAGHHAMGLHPGGSLEARVQEGRHGDFDDI